ncbi:hypothetical protein [Nostoc sp. CHAB 5715]|uniref:hypothetical protein n=1 Tax=Nostoc sp. CHAB 5715 TaxID=2780400 RepID=UPI001E4F18A3|nr:hypothetical protein [Nostoc sp. CHAB 5715]MCC5620960.1 hypothetical protein [Nostoc sp. CHAB 5715]
MKNTTPQNIGVRFLTNAPLPRNSGAGALDTTRDGGLLPTFRLLCQVARAVARSQLLSCDSSGGFANSHLNRKVIFDNIF